MLVVLVLCSSCGMIQQTTLTPKSKKSDSCLNDIRNGLDYIFKSQDAKGSSTIYGMCADIVNMKSSQQFYVDATNEDYDRMKLWMMITDIKGKPHLTLFAVEKVKSNGTTFTKQNSFKKGIASYELSNCECNCGK